MEPSALAPSSIIGRLRGLSRVQQLLIGLGGTTLLFLLLNRKTVMTGAGQAFDFAKVQAFKLALPANVGRWAPQILSAAQKYNVDPFVLAGIMYGESLGGDALSPGKDGRVKFGGPGGTGDFILRKPGNLYYKYADPATGLPPDGLGWGRGLMQVDYGVHNAWIISNNWRDPQTNINKAAEIFRDALKYFSSAPGGPITIEQWRVTTGMPQNGTLPWRERYPDRVYPTSARDPRPLSGAKLYEAAIAGYNAGYKGPLQALAVGLPAEAVTAHQTYVSNFLKRIGAWQAKFQ